MRWYWSWLYVICRDSGGLVNVMFRSLLILDGMPFVIPFHEDPEVLIRECCDVKLINRSSIANRRLASALKTEHLWDAWKRPQWKTA